MLSVASVKSSAGAAAYFAKDDYYTGEHASEASAWGGTGAEALALSGEVSKASFEAVLNGVLPDGTAVGQVQNRQSGVDLTFSMPKSASVLAYVAGDQRILDAHLAAVQATMRWTEKNFAEGRTYERTKNGEPVRTGSLVYALFQHDTSRALDPQGHIHVVIANLTRMANGAWQALHNGALWKNNTAIGAAYHAEFRAGLEKLGYRTELTGKHGQFEVQGVPKAVIDAFSQRRETILAKSEELGIVSPAGRDRVTTNSRDPKLNVEDRQALRAEWVERAAVLGFDGRALAEEARGRAAAASAERRPSGVSGVAATVASLADTLGDLFRPGDALVDRGLYRLRLSPTDLRAQHAVASAIRILEQREAAFALPDIARAALNLGLSGVTAARVDARVAELIRTERLLPGASARIDGHITHVTTPEAVAGEARILAEIEKGKGAAPPIVPADAVIDRLQQAAGDTPLNAGQLAAATLALSSQDRIVAVQGVAGAGKSTMIAALASVARDEGRQVIGLAFQNKMVGDLAASAGIEARTVSSFVNAYARHALAGRGDGYEAARQSLRGTVLLVDESSMIANEPMRHLVGIANALEVDRLVLVGDRQQLSAIDAGKSFALAQAGGVALARMDDNLRQRTDQLRTVAALANRGEAGAALGVLGAAVVERSDHVAAAAERWLGLSREERETTAVFASGRAARAELNTRIQDGLRSEGSLGDQAVTLSVLERVNVTREEMRYPQTYRSGQVLEVGREMSELGLRRGTHDITRVDARGRVEIKMGNRAHRFDPQRIDPADKRDALGLSTREQLQLHKGDQIRWTMNDKPRSLDNAALAKVVAIGKVGVTVETAARTTLDLKHGDPMLERLGLAYALNMHMAQGITADRGIAAMASHERNLSNQRMFNVTVTRVRDALELFTDDRTKLAAQLDRNPGDKTSALETTGKLAVDTPAEMKGERAKPDFNPSLPPDLARTSRVEASSLRVAAPTKDIAPPLPQKELGLEL